MLYLIAMGQIQQLHDHKCAIFVTRFGVALVIL